LMLQSSNLLKCNAAAGLSLSAEVLEHEMSWKDLQFIITAQADREISSCTSGKFMDHWWARGSLLQYPIWNKMEPHKDSDFQFVFLFVLQMWALVHASQNRTWQGCCEIEVTISIFWSHSLGESQSLPSSGLVAWLCDYWVSMLGRQGDCPCAFQCDFAWLVLCDWQWGWSIEPLSPRLETCSMTDRPYRTKFVIKSAVHNT
jgi:hypothetical protein